MFDANFFLESTRLYLSYMLPENDAHCDFLVKLWNTPEFIKSVGGEPTSITTREAARDLLAGRFQKEHERNGYGMYLISLKPNLDHGQDLPAQPTQGNFQEHLTQCTPVGTVSLMQGEPPNCYGAPDLGFAVHPDHMRQKIATEASTLLLDYYARETGRKDVLGLFDPSNEASRAVFRKLGFEDRGERVLKFFGGVTGAVFVTPGMDHDLTKYGL